MCLIVKPNTEIQVLKEPMIVYKTLQKTEGVVYKSIYFDFLYEIGVLQKEVSLEISNVLPQFADNASYEVFNKANNVEWCNAENFVSKGLAVAYQRGYHFYASLERVGNNFVYPHNAIGEMEIPAGASVIFDESGLGVASNIRLIKILENV